jgi:hypothetical protein
VPTFRLDLAFRPLLVLLAVGLALRALVPTGWMPVLDVDGLRLELCGGWQAATPIRPSTMAAHHGAGGHQMATAPAGHHQPKGKHEKAGDQPCAFAAAALAWLGDVGPREMPTALATVAALPFPAAVGIGRGLAAPPPPSTGPPSLS